MKGENSRRGSKEGKGRKVEGEKERKKERCGVKVSKLKMKVQHELQFATSLLISVFGHNVEFIRKLNLT